MRRILGLVAGAAVAAAGAVVLGEYAFAGPAVVGAGALLGLFVAEAALTVAGTGGRPFAAGLGGLTVAGLLWAAWIATGHRLGEVPASGWLAVAVGGAAAFLRTLWWRTPAHTRPEPTPAD